MDLGLNKMDKPIDKIGMLGKKNRIDDKKNDETIPEKILLKVFRAGGRVRDFAHFDRFEVPVQRWTTVLDALLYAKSYSDSSLGIRYSCRMASCGSCGMKINGKPRLACYTKISELNDQTIVCDPLPSFPRIRDLVTDFTEFFAHHKKIEPYIHNEKVPIEVVNKDDLVE